MSIMTTDRLHVSTIDVKPRTVDWSGEEDGEYREPYPFWEAFEFEDDDTDQTWSLIASGGSVVAVVIDGHPFTSYDEYADHYRDSEEYADETGEALTETEFDSLMSVEPFMHGAEGPMMNYFYPIEESDGPWGRSFDATDAAVKLADLPLCVVEIDGEYGLALTGGGMDLSWEICAAYVALGKQPPVHFRDLPSMADRWTERHESTFLAMVRSLEITAEWMTHGVERLNGTRDRMRGRGES